MTTEPTLRCYVNLCTHLKYMDSLHEGFLCLGMQDNLNVFTIAG